MNFMNLTVNRIKASSTLGSKITKNADFKGDPKAVHLMLTFPRLLHNDYNNLGCYNTGEWQREVHWETEQHSQ